MGYHSESNEKLTSTSFSENDRPANGEVSLLHVVNICNHRNSQKLMDLNGNTLRSLWVKGIQNLQDVGRWVIEKSGEVLISECEQHFDRTWSSVAHRNWTALTNAF